MNKSTSKVIKLPTEFSADDFRQNGALLLRYLAVPTGVFMADVMQGGLYAATEERDWQRVVAERAINPSGEEWIEFVAVIWDGQQWVYRFRRSKMFPEDREEHYNVPVNFARAKIKYYEAYLRWMNTDRLNQYLTVYFFPDQPGTIMVEEDYHQRNPKSDPMPGDVLEKAGKTRTVIAEHHHQDGSFGVLYRTEDKERLITYPSWRSWAQRSGCKVLVQTPPPKTHPCRAKSAASDPKWQKNRPLRPSDLLSLLIHESETAW